MVQIFKIFCNESLCSFFFKKKKRGFFGEGGLLICCQMQNMLCEYLYQGFLNNKFGLHEMISVLRF